MSRLQNLIAALLIGTPIALYIYFETTSSFPGQSKTKPTFWSTLKSEITNASYTALLILVSPLALHTVTFMALFKTIHNAWSSIIGAIMAELGTIMTICVVGAMLFGLVVLDTETAHLRGKNLRAGGRKAAPRKEPVKTPGKEAKDSGDSGKKNGIKTRRPVLDIFREMIHEALMSSDPELMKEVHDFIVEQGYGYLFERPGKSTEDRPAKRKTEDKPTEEKPTDKPVDTKETSAVPPKKPEGDKFPITYEKWLPTIASLDGVLSSQSSGKPQHAETTTDTASDEARPESPARMSDLTGSHESDTDSIKSQVDDLRERLHDLLGDRHSPSWKTANSPRSI